MCTVSMGKGKDRISRIILDQTVALPGKQGKRMVDGFRNTDPELLKTRPETLLKREMISVNVGC